MWKVFLKIIKNKYFLAFFVLLVWLTFFDNNDIFTRQKINKNLKELRELRDFYKSEIIKDSVIIYELSNNPEALERFAREELLMKKDDEDIFLISNVADIN